MVAFVKNKIGIGSLKNILKQLNHLRFKGNETEKTKYDVLLHCTARKKVILLKSLKCYLLAMNKTDTLYVYMCIQV